MNKSAKSARLESSLKIFRIWPTDDATAIEFAEIYRELRLAGKMLSQFDLSIAATVRQLSLTLLSADRDFRPGTGLDIENWL